jgi:hypothetical protein
LVVESAELAGTDASEKPVMHPPRDQHGDGRERRLDQP